MYKHYVYNGSNGTTHPKIHFNFILNVMADCRSLIKYGWCLNIFPVEQIRKISVVRTPEIPNSTLSRICVSRGKDKELFRPSSFHSHIYKKMWDLFRNRSFRQTQCPVCVNSFWHLSFSTSSWKKVDAKMSFKVVKIVEKIGICYSVVPEKWEQDNILFWPKNVANKQLAKLSSNAASTPQPDWLKMDCAF